MPLVVVAIGGNSLVQSHQVGNIPEQFENAAIACTGIADVIERDWDVVLTHGNGPQVGNVLLRVEMASHQIYPLPLDICDADTEGGIGYMLQQVLGNTLRRRGVERTVVTFVTQILVDEDDPAFQNPTKPIGPFFDEDVAEERKQNRGWKMIEDAGRGWRRVVPSPQPLQIVEIEAIRRCVGDTMVPIAVGGGGVPVIRRDGDLVGVEAVVDKDLASALLGNVLGADTLLISTGVDQVQIRFNTPQAEPLGEVGRDEIRQSLAAGEFPAGSMGPKIRAALQFLDGGGQRVIITSPSLLLEAIDGEAGTRIV
ncbi:MAG: carbamate kinase [Myxococcota bacterium]